MVYLSLRHPCSQFDLTIRGSYFTILAKVFMNHILTEITYFTSNVEWTEHKTKVLKPANKHQIIL